MATFRIVTAREQQLSIVLNGERGGGMTKQTCARFGSKCLPYAVSSIAHKRTN